MTFGRSALRTLGFAGAYLLASYAGRLTVMDGTNLSLVWPAAGVSAVWFLTQRRSRWFALDLLALAAVTVAANMLTGAPLALSLWFVAANITQALVFTSLFGRWLPHAWGGGGDRPLERLSDLWRVSAAAFVATVCGALVGPTGAWIASGTYSWPATSVWLTRNTVSILLIGVAGLRIGYLLHRHRQGTSRRSCPSELASAWMRTRVLRRAEYVAVVVLSTAAYVLAFTVAGGLPLAFVLIVMTVWVGLRLHTTFVVAHDLTFGALAILFTLHGTGPFAQIDSHAMRALIAQLFVGTIAVVGLALALGRDERSALIAELRDSHRAASRQAQMMTTIVDSMTEGLGVFDGTGRVLLRNRAADHLLGGADGTGYELFRLDGTPLADADLPYRRALAGETVQDVDLRVRHAALPDGRVVSFSATPLPADIDGARYAVSVFRDVTADRRHRDELTTFAGVVAHDLLNPLATIEGWSEALAYSFESARDDPLRTGALQDIARIQRAAARMRNLINDLLAHTTARDAALAPVDTDLERIVADIAAARVDHASSTGAAVPVFGYRDLHRVHADPVLIRQLTDNIVGNAVKYTAAGTTPHITVETHAVDHGLVRVDITDNGIGVPAGQHDAIFANFHRAHRTSAYAGTGLGLAICKRIVERHAGTIVATDNPGGPGTRISFTLPATARVPAAAGRTGDAPPTLRR